MCHILRHTTGCGDKDTLRLWHDVRILRVADRGDTSGEDHGFDLSIQRRIMNRNAGRIALLVRLGVFESRPAGDRVSGEWRGEPPTGEAVVESGAIHYGNDIGVLKISDRGSDTRTDRRDRRDSRERVVSSSGQVKPRASVKL